MRMKPIIFTCILCLVGFLIIAQSSSDYPSDIIDEIPTKIHPRWTSFVNTNYISDLKIDGDYLWIVGGGVKRYNLTNNKYTFYFTEHGLASNDTRAIAVEDKFIWVATAAGVSRYDKKEKKWHNFYPSDGLAEEVVVAITIDKARRQVWFGTWESGASRFDLEKRSWKTFNSHTGLVDDTVITIAVDNKEKAVWFGTWGGGLSKLNLKTGSWKTWSKENNLPQNVVTSIAMDGDYVWLGTLTAGVCRYHKIKDKWEYFTTQNGLSGNKISCIKVDPNRKSIWIATRDGGVCRFRKDTNQWQSLPLKESEANDTTSLAFHKNSLFVGTWGRGFWHYDLVHQRGKNFITPGEISYNRVVSVVPDKKSKKIWFATEGGGASSFDLNKNRWRRYDVENEFLPNDVVNKISIDQRSRTIWFGTDDGVIGYRLDPELNKFCRALEKEFIYSLFPEKDKLWAGLFNGGLYYLHINTNKWHKFQGLPGSTFYSIVVDEREGKIWGGTEQGVVLYDKKTSQQVSLDLEKSLLKAEIRKIHLDKTRNLVWIGSWGAGLYKFDYHSKKWQIYTREDGLPSNYALGIDIDNFDKGTLWVASDKGVGRYDLKTGQWQTFTAKDGLAHDLTLSVAVDRDSVWVGTWGGGASRYKLERK